MIEKNFKVLKLTDKKEDEKVEEHILNDPEDFCGIPDKELDEMFRQSVRLSIEASKNAKKPIAQYDIEKRKAYKLYPDGTRIYD